jgi:hypothetical protein
MSTETASELEKHVVASINAERAAAGLPDLKIEVHLSAAAQEHSDWMGETGSFTHAGEGGSTPTERIGDSGFPLGGSSWATAENIAYSSIDGQLDTGEADKLHEGLMDSPEHRANILNPDVAYVGVGFSVGQIELEGVSREVAFLTEDFGDTDGRVLVQEEQDGQTVYQPYQDGEPVGEAQDPGDLPEDPDAPPDPDDPNEDQEQSSAGGGCFVATAAYGSYGHPDVVALRRFRDEVLVHHATGRALIRWYLRVGPRLGRRVRPDGVSGRIARALIAPLARLVARR